MIQEQDDLENEIQKIVKVGCEVQVGRNGGWGGVWFRVVDIEIRNKSSRLITIARTKDTCPRGCFPCIECQIFDQGSKEAKLDILHVNAVRFVD